MELEQIERVIENAGLYTYLGKIDKIVGTTVESTGPACRLGDVCTIDVVEGGSPVMAEKRTEHESGSGRFPGEQGAADAL